jgi:cytochrome P450
VRTFRPGGLFRIREGGPQERTPYAGPMDTSAIFDPAVWEIAPPYEVFAGLRARDPVAFVEHPDGHRGAWVVSRHAELVAVSRDPQTFSSRDGVVSMADLEPDQLEARRTLLEEDPPRHTALRRLVAADLLPRAVRAYEGMVRDLTRVVLDEALRRDRFDAVPAIAQEVPIRVLCRLLGVPERHTEELAAIGTRMVTGATDPDASGDLPPSALRLLPFGHAAAVEAFAIASELADERRRSPTDDLTSRLVNGTIDGVPLTDREFQTMWLFLVIAGNETTRHAISLGLAELLQRRDLLDRWAEDPRLDATAADEILRVTSPINWHRRTVTRPTELAGRNLATGDKVALAFVSANRDDIVFDRPDELVLDRRPNPHVTFGRGGPHFCLGAHLAQLEIRIVFRELFERLSDLRPAGPPVRLRSDHFNGLVSLPVEVVRR